MIHPLRYESRGQRQRFEPREQQSSEEQHKHIHLHLHLNLTFRARQGRFSPLGVSRLTRIFAALNVASTMAFLFAWMMMMGDPLITPLRNIAVSLLLAGLALAWGAVVLGGLPLLVSAWRRSPRVRFLLVIPFIQLILLLSTITLPSNFLWGGVNALKAFIIILVVGGVYPLISALVFHQALRRAEISSTVRRFARRLSFVVVGAMVLLLLGGFLVCLSFGLAGVPWLGFLLPLLGMCLAVIVAAHALLWRPRSQEHAQARPKDASPSDA